ncbi:MAG: hypothetical protein NC402_07460 [Prevotella sp.]|nr:hypothetical protein [Prevotella sp.]MCM1074239.1 hypothetical protein [Ruminococcus sp.]
MTTASAANIGLTHKLTREQRIERAHKAPRNAVKWLPGTVTDYYYNGQEWEQSNVTTYTYNPEGWVLSQTSQWEKKENTYNAEGNVIEEVFYGDPDGQGLSPQYKYVYTYDNVVTGFRTSEKYYNYENGQWVLRSEDQNVITRNELGNIIKIQERYYDAEYNSWEDGDYFEITYGADGKAVTVKTFEDGEIELDLRDIVWNRTNGQIIISDSNDIDADDFFMGSNRIASATVYGFEGNTLPGYLNATYEGTEGSYKVEIKINDKVAYSMDYKVLDNYGSYSSAEFSINYEEDETTGNVVEDGNDRYVEEVRYDAYGLLTEETQTEYRDGEQSYTYAEKGIVTYDTTNGYPVEYICQNKQGEEFVNSARQVFSDYVQVSGVEQINAESESPVEYYNLQGIRVFNPEHGIFIRRQGSKATKVIF